MRDGRICGLAMALSCAALSFSFSAIAREAPATAAEKDEAFRAYVACEQEKSRMLDDGYSDAMTVGGTVAFACRPEMENVAAVLAKGEKRDRVRLLLIDRLASHAAQDAATVVLLERRKRAGADRGSPEEDAAVQSSPAGVESLERREATKQQVDREAMMTGADLSAACKQGGEAEVRCSAFIRGVFGAYSAGIIDAGGQPRFCLPKRYFAFEWIDDVESFVESHPALAQSVAEKVVIAAMIATHPCAAG